MAARCLVVIGASAGGLEALRTVMAGIPETFSAAIGIVIHISAESPGVIPEILNRATGLPVAVASDGQRLLTGHVFVAPPDRHLIIEPGRVR